MLFCKSLGNLEIDYDKKEVRTGGRRIDFGQISHYEFEYASFFETMRVCGRCEELPDNHPLSVTTDFEKAGLKLWFFYYQNEELKQSSLDFSQNNAIEARNKLKPLINYLREWRISENFNMFVGEQHLRIGSIASLNVPLKDFNIHKADLPIFGTCSVHAYGKEVVTHINLSTERKLSEEEMLPMLEYMKKSMPVESSYDDYGYGVMPKPHEINLFWELPQGKVKMSWDGFNYTRGDEPNQPRGDGMDYVRIELWDCVVLQQTRDEAYYRSLVD